MQLFHTSRIQPALQRLTVNTGSRLLQRAARPVCRGCNTQRTGQGTGAKPLRKQYQAALSVGIATCTAPLQTVFGIEKPVWFCRDIIGYLTYIRVRVDHWKENSTCMQGKSKVPSWPAEKNWFWPVLNGEKVAHTDTDKEREKEREKARTDEKMSYNVWAATVKVLKSPEYPKYNYMKNNKFNLRTYLHPAGWHQPQVGFTDLNQELKQYKIYRYLDADKPVSVLVCLKSLAFYSRQCVSSTVYLYILIDFYCTNRRVYNYIYGAR